MRRGGGCPLALSIVSALLSGGLVVSLKVGSTSLAFVSCHLAAHEGEKYLKRRHDNVSEIINVSERAAHEGPRSPESNLTPRMIVSQTGSSRGKQADRSGG